MKRFLAVLFIVVFSFPAVADPEFRESPPVVSGPVGEPVDQPEVPPDVTALIKGQAAPHSGLLVREERFTKMLKAEGRVPELIRELDVEKRLSGNIESLYNQKLEEAVKPPPWYKSPWAYFILGIAVATAAIYGGAQLVKVAN